MTAPTRPSAPTFRLVRYFAVASLAVLLPVAATLLYFDRQEDELFKQVQREHNAFSAQMQNSFVQRHDAAAPAYLVRVYEAGNVNLARLFANALWDKDLAPLVANAQRIPVDQCRAIADVKDAGGWTVPPGEKQACHTGIGKQIMALPEFRALDAKLLDLVKNSTALKLKVYDLRGITIYSSEHNQIGENRNGIAGLTSAMAGKPATELTHRDRFNAFHGVVENRDVIASYVPILAPGSERIVAVFEVYSDVTQFLGQIRSTSSMIRELTAANRAQMERAAAANQDKVDAAGKQMLAIVLGLFALSYCALFLIARHGQRIIEKQDSERKRAGLVLSRQKDLYDVLSQSNKAIVHLVDRGELFAAVCRIAVEHGRFRFAWIGLIDGSDSRLKPVARYGDDAGYIDQLNLSGDAAHDARRGLTARTLLSGACVIRNDFLNDPAMMPWHEAARRAGVRASAKFPIRQGGAVIGAISFCAGEPGFFADDLVATLDEIASDVSFALDNYAREAARKQAEEALRAAEDLFRGLVEQSIAGIYIIQDGRLAYVNPRFAEIMGYDSAAELTGIDVLLVVAENERAAVAEKIREWLRGPAHSIGYSTSALRKDGSTVDVGVHAARASHRGRPAIIGLLQDISEKKRAEEQVEHYVAQLEKAFMRTVEVATTLSEMRDPYTAGHERRVAEIAVAIGAELGFDARRQEGLRVAGYLHDIGKITIPAEILSKPTKLTPIEYELIKGHPQASYDVLKNVEFPWPVAEIALQHHERIDGSGYPQGLKGDAILLEARITAVADVVEAMSSHRPYRPGLGIEKALAEIERGRGTAYDAAVADACLKLFRVKGYAIPI